MFKYRIYGLNVLSDRQLDCYLHEFDTADFSIKFIGDENDAERTAYQLCNSDKPYWIKPSTGIGMIYVCENNNIVVYYKSDYDLKHSIVNYIFGYAISILFLRRNIFLLHSSSVAIDDTAIAIVGNTGSGKSSLAAGFTQIGGKILTDDMTRIEVNTNNPFVYPGIPTHRLHRNTIEYLGYDLSRAFEIPGEKEKFLICDNQDSFLDRNVKLNAMICLYPSNEEDIYLVREDVKHTLWILCHCFHNNRMILQSNNKSEYYDYILKMCEKIPMYTLHRPRNTLKIDGQIDAIIKEIFKR